MKRRPRPSPDQPDLFAARAPAWVAVHWPDYVRGTSGHERPARPPLEQWAEAVEHLEPATRALLVTLARDSVIGAPLSISIPTLARSTSVSRNTLRRRLDALLERGFVMLRPIQRGGAHAGYEVILVVDDGERIIAIAEGFTSKRIISKQAIGKALNDG